MNDRELLELAAKAAGYKVHSSGKLFWIWKDSNVEWVDWNPLTDDGDALRLVVRLGLAVRVLEKCVFVESAPETLLGQSSVSDLEMYGNSDPYTATRHAIVRAAAEIGRNMK